MSSTIAFSWTRLAELLTDAGYPAKVTERPYPGGVSRSIFYRVNDGFIDIRGRWDRHGRWAGYQAWHEDRHSIVTAERLDLVSRVDVVLYVTSLMEGRTLR